MKQKSKMKWFKKIITSHRQKKKEKDKDDEQFYEDMEMGMLDDED